MKCDACGAPVENGKCTYCGKVFVTAETDYSAKPAAQPVIQPESQNPKMKKKNLITCKSCGGDVAKGVKKCPHCGAKIKKPVYKKIWFWIVVIALISAIAGGGSSKDDNSSSSSASTSSASTKVEQQVKDSQEQVEEAFDDLKNQAEQIIDEAKENAVASVNDEPKKSGSEPVKEDTSKEDKTVATKSYESIYNEYVKKIQEATPGLIEEYKAEAANNTNGLEGLAEISNNKVMELAEIANAGVEEMASIMLTIGTGKYDEYEEWSTKLYKVYEDEASKIYDAYMKSAF